MKTSVTVSSFMHAGMYSKRKNDSMVKVEEQQLSSTQFAVEELD